MKVVAFASFKGGAGKTTALMAGCSSLVALGQRVALFEADPNAPLSRWRELGREQDTWDDSCTIYAADSVDVFAASMEKAEATGHTIALVDTQGGGSDLNNAILVNAQLVAVPSTLSPLDIDAALDTVEYLVRLYTREGEDIPVGVLLQRMPSGQLTMSQRADMKLLASLPQFETQFPERDAYRSIKSRGMLHKLHAKLAAEPLKHIAARHIATALRESDAFASEILAIVNREVADAV
jgi:cellulose biosynthesis protein BcsQ